MGRRRSRRLVGLACLSVSPVAASVRSLVRLRPIAAISMGRRALQRLARCRPHRPPERSLAEGKKRDWLIRSTGGSGASPEVLSPSAFAGHAALSGAAGIRTIPLRRYHSRSAAMRIGGASRHRHESVRPCGFPPAFACGVLRPRVLCERPAGASAVPVRRGDAARSGRIAWPGRSHHAAPAALLGFLPFAVLLLPAGGRAFPPVLAHLPFSPSVLTRSFSSGDRSRRSRLPLAPTREPARTNTDTRDRLLGFGPAGNPYLRRPP